MDEDAAVLVAGRHAGLGVGGWPFAAEAAPVAGTGGPGLGLQLQRLIDADRPGRTRIGTDPSAADRSGHRPEMRRRPDWPSRRSTNLHLDPHPLIQSSLSRISSLNLLLPSPVSRVVAHRRVAGVEILMCRGGPSR